MTLLLLNAVLSELCLNVSAGHQVEVLTLAVAMGGAWSTES